MKPVIIAIILIIASSASSQAYENPEGDLFRIMGWTTYGVMAGDVVTTEIGLSRPGIYEANPLMRNRAVRLSAHVAAAVAANYATARLHRAGHEKAALWFRVAVVVGYGYLVAHNLRKIN